MDEDRKAVKRRQPPIAAMVTLAIGTILLTIASWERFKTDDSLNFPIDLRAGATRSGSFRVFQSGYHPVELVPTRTASVGDIPCLLGASPPELPTCARPSPVDIEWSLYADGRLVEHGRSAGNDPQSAMGGMPARWLGGVTLHPGTNYALTVTSLSDAPAVGPLSPHIVVTESGEAVEGDIATMAISAFVGIALILAGTTWIGVTRRFRPALVDDRTPANQNSHTRPPLSGP
jgi:hypothetical protein